MSGRGAPDLPLTYHGAYDAAVTYPPRQVVTDGGAVFMSLATSTGQTPATSPGSWLLLAGGGPIYLEAIVKAGSAVVGTNIMPPGIRVPADTTLRAVYLELETAPTGADLVFVLKRKSTGVTLATVTVAAGTTSGSVTGLSAALTAGELLRCDITAIGSTVPGADVLLSIVGY